MSESPNKLTETQHTFDPSIQTENIAFGQDELIVCKDCGRKNPPNRLKCLYCAHDLEIKAEDTTSIKPFLRKLELWERGFSLIVRDQISGINIERSAQFLSLESSDLVEILNASEPLPVARVESEMEAAIAATQKAITAANL